MKKRIEKKFDSKNDSQDDSNTAPITTDNRSDNVYYEHTKKYTNLLEVFIQSTKSFNNQKKCLKTWFFMVIVSIMIMMCFIFGYAVYKSLTIIYKLSLSNLDSLDGIIASVVSIIPPLSTMIISLIKLPKIIADYLFNREEDKNMVAIIEKIQKYDIDMFSLEYEIEKMRMEDEGDRLANANSNLTKDNRPLLLNTEYRDLEEPLREDGINNNSNIS